MRGVAFAVWTLGIVGLVLAQSVGHLAMVLGADRIDTFADLDRSNGLPDLVSTLVLASAATAAVKLWRREPAPRPGLAVVLAALLGALTLADLLHDGAHPYRNGGPLVVGLVLAAVGLLAVLAIGSSGRVRWTLAVGMCFLACSFLLIGLDRLDHRFERERGDPTAEYQIVAKEGLELLGWSLVALALWDEALRRRRGGAAVATGRASPARAPSRRHAA